MIDWDGLVVGPLVGVFGEAITYQPAPASPIYTATPISITAVFDEAYTPVSLSEDPSVISAHPLLGVRLSDMPAGYDPKNAQEDQFTVLRTGRTYIVRAGRNDSHGWARLDANLAPQ